MYGWGIWFGQVHNLTKLFKSFVGVLMWTVILYFSDPETEIKSRTET